MSIQYFDFVNQLDKMLNDLLYSSSGYTSLLSKDAVDNYQNFLHKFDNEIIKMRQKHKIFDFDPFIKEKSNAFIRVLDKHCIVQSQSWAQEVYKETIDNCLFAASINKHDEFILKKLCNKAHMAINWIANIKKMNCDELKILKDKFRNDFLTAINSNDFDYLPENTLKSDKKTYIALRNLILKDENNFLELNLQQYSSRLSKKDFSFFQKCQNDLQTFKKNILLEDLRLIDCALKILKINDINQQYDFLIQIDNDFTAFCYQNKKINEVDKIEILKKRIKLFKDSSENNFDYYKSVINF